MKYFCKRCNCETERLKPTIRNGIRRKVGRCKVCQNKRNKLNNTKYSRYDPIKDREYKQKHAPYYAAQAANYRAKRIQRTPAWLTGTDKRLIKSLYQQAALMTQVLGQEYQVDHIYPLQGKHVSGLHVPQNLQVISARDNQVKGNK